MRTYRLPGYETRLLTELQRQQLSYTFCDTLLQTEDLCVPAHSCVLAALSPYLSQKLSTAPRPPPGQKRLVRLRDLKPQTLLNLVSLLYSGRLEVAGHAEQNELLAAACRLGMVVAVEGQNEWFRRYKVNPEDASESKKKPETEVEVEATQREKDSSQVKRSCSSTEEATGDKHVTSGPGSVTSQPQSITHEGLGPDLFTLILSEERSDEDSANPAAAASQSSYNLNVPVPLRDAASSSLLPVDDVARQPASEPLDCGHVSAGGKDGRVDGRTSETGRGDGGEETGNCAETRPVNPKVAKKSLAKMQRMMATTQVSVKVKLRKTKGKGWKVVRLQERDKRLSVVTSLTQKPQTQIPRPANTVSREPAPPPDASQRLPAVAVAPAPVAQPEAPVEESDEQIEKLLEDIMMGLNILPDLRSDCKTSRDLSSALNAAVCRLPATDSVVTSPWTEAPAPTCCAGVHHHTAQTQPCCSLLSPLAADTELIQLQQQRSPHTEKLLPTTLNNLHRETTASVIASALYSIAQDPCCPEFQTAALSGTEPSFPSPRLDDLRLRPCLSPLEPCTSPAKPPTVLRRGRPWLTEKPEVLQFPLKNIAFRKKKHCTALKHKTSCIQSTLQHLEFNLQHGGTKEDKVGGMESDPRNTKGKRETKGDSVATKRRKRTRHRDPEASVGSLSPHRDFKVNNQTEAQIILGVCSVSLSSNNVLAKGSSTAMGTTPEPHRNDRARIRTRGFLRRAQAAPSNTSAGGSSLPKAEAKTVRKAASPPKRKPGRQENLGVPPGTDWENRRQNESDSPTNDLSETKRVSSKRKRRMNDGVEVTPQKKTINAATAVKEEGHGDMAAAEKRRGKTRRMVSLKELQQLIKRQHLKTRKFTKNQESVKSPSEHQKTADNERENGAEETEIDVDVMQLEDEESQVVNLTVDNNHNQVFRKDKAGDEGSQPGAEFNLNILEEEEAESEQPLIDQDQAWSCRSGSDPRTPERTGSQSGRLKEEKEEEEEEVDILLCSPDKISQPRVCEVEPEKINITADEEEDEDLIEVDVTGDEAE